MDDSPRTPRGWQFAVAAATVVVATLLVGVYFASSSPAPPSGPGATVASYPFPPVWTSTIPRNTAFGGVLQGNSYYAIVPQAASVLPSINNLEFDVVALNLQTGELQWTSPAIAIQDEGNIEPTLVGGASELYVVGYSAPLVVPGEPWNGSTGVFAIGLDPTTGVPNAYASGDVYPTSWIQVVSVNAGSVYYGAILSGSAVLSAFPLPDQAVGSGVSWNSSFALPAGFSSNLAFAVDDGFVLVLLPSSIVVVSATTGSLLESIVDPSPLNLFDGTIVSGVAYGVQWLSTGFFLQGYQLSDGSLVLNASIPSPAVPGQPFFVDAVDGDLLVTIDSGATWSAYSTTGSVLWNYALGTTSFPLPPVPIGTDQVLFQAGPPANFGLESGNFTFHEGFSLLDLSTGALVWQTDPLLAGSTGEALFTAPNSMEQPPSPTVDGYAGNDVVFWWAGETALATL